MAIVKYLDPKNDVAFRKIFGTPKNKKILIHFLNDLLGKAGAEAIKSVSFQNSFQLPDISTQKQSVVDVRCTDQQGKQYIVEMQVAPTHSFDKRAQYYAAKAYVEQAVRGKNTYENLKEVIFLAITEFVMFPNKRKYKSKEHKSVHVFKDEETHEHDLKDISFIFIELPKFNKKIKDLVTFEDKWCYFFKHAHEPDNIEQLIAMNDDVIKQAYTQLVAHNWTKQELQEYEAIQKNTMDAIAREDYVREEGTSKGMAEGMEKGIVQGIEKGIEKGKADERLAIAKRMLAEGMDIKTISKITGLSLKEQELERQ